MFQQHRIISADDGSEFTCVAWDSAGLCAGDMNGKVYIWRSQEDNKVLPIDCDHYSDCAPHKLAVNSIDTKGDVIVSSSLDGSICKTDVAGLTSTPVAEEVKDPVVVCLAGEILLVGTCSGKLVFVSLETGAVSATIELFADSPVVSISVHAATGKAYALSTKELVCVDIAGRAEDKRGKIAANCATCVAVTDDGFTCAVTATDGAVHMIDTVSFREVGMIPLVQTELNKIVAYNYGQKCACASIDGQLSAVDVRKMIKSGQRTRAVRNQPIIGLAGYEQARLVASAAGSTIYLHQCRYR